MNIKLRVYNRDDDSIILLWNTPGLTSDQLSHVVVQVDGRRLQVITERWSPKQQHIRGLNTDVMVCHIPHGDNQLTANKDYKLQIVLGGQDGPAVQATLMVYRVNVLPEHERDRKSSNVHLMAWDPTADSWVKLPVVHTPTGVAIPVVIIERQKE